MDLNPETPKTPNPRRAAAASGRRFELAVARKLRRAGFFALRVDETSGYSHGVDVRVFYRYRTSDQRVQDLNVALQCKATKRPGDLLAGLREAKEGAPDARLWACVHSLRTPGKPPLIRVVVEEPGREPRIDTFTYLVRRLYALAGVRRLPVFPEPRL